MNNEFKKIKIKNETRYVLETMTAGGTGASSIATAPGSIKMLQRRLAELKDKISVPVSKPRNPVGMGTTQGRGTQKHQANQRQKAKDDKKLYELEKPSGQMFLKFRGKRLPNDEMMILAYGGFGTTPKEVTVANAKVKPFAADDASDVISHIRRILSDKDFIGVEKIVLDIPQAFMGQLHTVIDYADQDERLELYTDDNMPDDPEANTGGKVIGIGPDGKRINREPAKAQVGGSSRGVASTGMVTVQADSTGQKLISSLVSQGKLSRDTKVQGNKITLRKDDYSKMMSVLGNAKFQQMFTKVDSVAEGDEQDHEISMASSELQSITKDAAQLLDMVRQRSEEEGLDAWQQSKITKAADFMNSVLQSLSGDEQGVAEGSKNQLPVVLYRELPDDQISGREFFQVVKSQSPYWKVGETFSDDDMSMGSQQVRFVSVKQGVAEDDETPGYIKYEQMKDKIASVLIKLYNQGKDEETIKQMSSRVAKHLGYNPEDPIYQDAWMSSFTDASLDGRLDGEPEDDYTDYTMRRGEMGRKGVAEAKGLKKRVRIVKGPTDVIGKFGWIGEVHHGSYQGAPKMYVVDLDGGGNIQLPGAALRLVKDQGINELSKDTLRAYSKDAGREVGNDQRSATSARDKAVHHISHGALKKGAEWSDEADWLNKRAEKRAGGIARATTKIAQKGMEEGLRDPKDNPCWKGYKPVGTKKKNGKTVPNCVPTNEDNYFRHLTTALESKLKK